ncbi:MAG: DNA polymerase domain-containing protein [Puniceicoccaceae bacterium]
MNSVGQLEPGDAELVGIHVDAGGAVNLALRRPDGAREDLATDFQPFCWMSDEVAASVAGSGASRELCGGKGCLRNLFHFEKVEDAEEMLKTLRSSPEVEYTRPLEHQYLIQARGRVFGRGSIQTVRRLQLDIETATGEGRNFSDPREKEDRVLAIGLRWGEREEILHLEAETDAAERDLMKRFGERLRLIDPDTVEGHNIFRFDLDYLRQRSRRFRVEPLWGRFGKKALFRPSRMRIAERTVDFPRCEIPGRTVVDTFLLVQLFDITKRELEGYGLKEVAVAFGISDAEDGSRTYLPGDGIAEAWRSDRKTFEAYLKHDLRETEGVAAALLPTYVAQCPNFPMSLQEILLRGTASKVDAVFYEACYHSRWALPQPPAVASFEGGYTGSFEVGVHQPVYHYDVASLYPSLLIQIGKNPAGDDLGIFIKTLSELREKRLDLKRRARQATDPNERRDLDARQASFKILINSFYGYLGFPGARFADGDLAAEVTRRGRDLIQKLIDLLPGLGARILEADTDGLYVCPDGFGEDPEGMLEALGKSLPEGIDLELGGIYDAMFCYKAKNYALRSGESVVIRGSALRSRGTEPFLRELTRHYIGEKLGLERTSTTALIEGMAEAIGENEYPVEALAKAEFLSQSPGAYWAGVEGGTKSRRASAEAALKLDPVPRQGDRVRYYLREGSKAEKADWQRAVPIEHYDREQLPYDSKHYLKKLKQWATRFPLEALD